MSTCLLPVPICALVVLGVTTSCLHGQFWTVCRLYENPKVSHTVIPDVVSHEWNAAVKK